MISDHWGEAASAVLIESCAVRRVLSWFLVVVLAAGGIFAANAASSQALSSGLSFGAVSLPTWQTNGVVYATAQARGMVLAGGSFTQVRPPNGGSGSAQARAGLVLLDVETGAPATCQFTLGGTARIRTILTSADGSTAYIGGDFSTVNGVARGRLAALDLANCSVRTAFNAGAFSAEVFGLADYGNTLYVAGGFTTIRGETRKNFAAVNATTGALLNWTADAANFADASVKQRGRAVAVSPDGAKVAIGGYFYYVNDIYSHSIAVVSGADPDTGNGGAVLKAYGPGFIPGNPNLTSANNAESPGGSPSGSSSTHVIISGADRFYIGNEGTGGGIFDGRAAFNWSDGEQIWRDNCLGATQALVLDGTTLYAANHAHDCSSVNAQQDGRRVYLTAQNADTMEHIGWKPDLNDGTGEGIGPRGLTIAVANSGKRYLWVGGEFTSVGGSPQQGLTRFADQSAAPDTPAPIWAKAMPNGTIQVRLRAVQDNDDSMLTYRLYRGNSETPIQEIQAESYWWQRPQITFVDNTVTPGTSYSYRVQVFDGTNSRTSGASVAVAQTPTNTYSTTVMADEPAGLYWDSSRNTSWIHDVSATKTTGGLMQGIASGPTSVSEGAVPGDASGSLEFNGVDDYVWNDKLRGAPTTYSVEMWFKTTTTRGGKLIGYGNGRPRTDNGNTVLSGSYDRQVYMTNDGKLIFGAYTGSAVTVSSSNSYNDGAWHHMVATQGAAGMTLYVDGLRVGNNANSIAQSYYGVWHVGGDNLSGWPNRPASNFFAGQIDETAVYDYVLNQNQVAEHAIAGGKTVVKNTVPADSYGKAVFDDNPDLFWRLNDSGSTAADSTVWGQTPGVYNTGVQHPVTGVLSGIASNPNNGAAQLAGNSSSTIATVSTITPAPVYSAEVWFKAPTNGAGKIFGFENTQTGNGTSYDKQLYMGNDGRLTYGTWVGYANTVTSSAVYNDDAWHHAVATQDSSGTKLYVDGSLVASNGTSGAESGAGYWRLGGGALNSWPNAPSNTYFNGAVDEFAVYSRALSAGTIRDHYMVVNPDTTAPSVPGNLASTVQGSEVQLSWAASTDNVGVTGYKVYRGDSADFAIGEASFVADVPAGSDPTIHYTDGSRPAGTVFYKVVAVDARNNASAASQALEVIVPDTLKPTVAQDLKTVVVNGDQPADTYDVSLSWKASADNVGVAGYLVYRGAEAGFTVDDATNKIADVPASGSASSYSYVDSARPAGTSYYKVVAVDAAGNRSDATEAAKAEVPDHQAPTAPGALTATLTPAGVQLGWAASTDNLGVTSYTVHRGATAGFAVGNDNKVGTVTDTGYLDAAPAGTWYYKVVALDQAGNSATSDASQSVTVTDGTAPTIPGTPTASVDDSDVSLAWAASTDDTGVTGYRVYRGTTADVTAQSGTLVGEPTGNEYVDHDAPEGTWFYRVAAVDAAGNTSELSAAVSATVVAVDTTAPSAPTGVGATADKADITVVWSAATDNVGVTGYRVYRGATSGFTPNQGSLVGSPSGLSFEDKGRPVGTYYYLVKAVDAAGNVSDASAEVSASVVAPPVEPVTVTVPVGADAAVVQTAATTNYGSDLQLFSRGTSGQQSFLRFALPQAPGGAVLTSATLQLRTSTDPTAATADVHSVDLVQGSWTESGINWNNRPTSATGNVGSITGVATTATTFTVPLAVADLKDELDGTVTLRISSEGTDNLRVYSREFGSSSYRPQLILTFSGSADEQAPSAPSGLSASVDGNDVALDWASSTDNVGVADYQVFRGASAGFTPSASNRIATVKSTSYTDKNVEPGVSYYKVWARDAAGNVSAPSSSVSATIAEPEPEPVTVTAPNLADASVVSTAPSTNYGSNNQVFSANASSQQQIFLRFQVPDAPSGKTLNKVSLRIRTSTDAAAGSTGTHAVQVVTGAWQEGTLTWANRPTSAGATVCTIADATTINTVYTVQCTASAFTPGQEISLRISTTSSDNLRLFSKEGPSAAFRPTLVAEFK